MARFRMVCASALVALLVHDVRAEDSPCHELSDDDMAEIIASEQSSGASIGSLDDVEMKLNAIDTAEIGYALVSIDTIASYLEVRTDNPLTNIASLREDIREMIRNEQVAGPGALLNMLDHLDAYEQALRHIRDTGNPLWEACRLLALNRAKLDRVRLGVRNLRVFQTVP